MKWQSMDDYQTGDSRDENGKWHPGPPGPTVELKMKTGRIVQAQWRGELTKSGGAAYAFWQDGSRSGIGIYDPDGWRLAKAEGR